MTETQELILNKLGELCRIYPQHRLGQIIYNYILRYCPNNDCFFIEDTKLWELLETIIKEKKKVLKKLKKLKKILDFNFYLCYN